MGLHITASGSNTYLLTDDLGFTIGALEYENVWKSKARVKWYDSDFLFRVKGAFNTKVLFLEATEKVALAEMKMTWKGNIKLETNFEGEKFSYTLQKKSIWNNQYVLVDADKNPLIVINAHVKLTQLLMELVLEELNLPDTRQTHLLLFNCIFGIRYLIQAQSAAAAS